MKHPFCKALVIAVLVTPSTVWTQTQPGDAAKRGDQVAKAETAPSPELNAAAYRPHNNSYIIGEDDLLGVNVWKEDNISRSIPVRSDGKISLPLVGEVQASGITPLELERSISDRLRNYITAPDVTVMVLQTNSQKFNILGRVTKPGSYPLNGTTTVLDAIAASGGFMDFAKQKSVYILRRSPGGRVSRIPFNYKEVIRGKHPEQNVQLQSHDTVVVP